VHPCAAATEWISLFRVVGRRRNNPERKKPYYDEKDKAALRLMRKLREVVFSLFFVKNIRESFTRYFVAFCLFYPGPMQYCRRKCGD
jgi:hypothetical protein